MMNLRVLPVAMFACLFLTGCLTDKDAVPPPEPVDCVTSGIPPNLLVVASHDEMIERYGKPSSEAPRSDGGIQATYKKIDVSRVYGCKDPSNQASQYQSVRFDFDSHRKFLTASSRAAEIDGNPVKRAKQRQGT